MLSSRLKFPPTPDSQNYVWRLSNRYNSTGSPLLDQFNADLVFRGRTPEEDRTVWTTHFTIPAPYTTCLHNPNFPDLEEDSEDLFSVLTKFISDRVREAYEPHRLRVEQEEHLFADHSNRPGAILQINNFPSPPEQRRLY